MALSEVVPFPSCPRLFDPQHSAAPPLVTAHVVHWPALTDTIVGEAADAGPASASAASTAAPTLTAWTQKRWCARHLCPRRTFETADGPANMNASSAARA